LELLQTAFTKESLNDYVIAIFSKPTRDQMIDPNKMRQDWNTTFTTFITSINDRWGISPNSEVIAPDNEVHKNLLIEIKRLINNTPGIYTIKGLEKIREDYENAQCQKKNRRGRSKGTI
jgi:hypothetical protein